MGPTGRPFTVPPSNAVFGAASACALAGNTLISLNSLNANGSAVTVTNNQVRYIANGGVAESVFGTPFGNVGRNTATDAVTNTANFTIAKRLKLNERASFELHMTLVNAFNHFNFTSVDPFLDDAGLHTSFTGFGDPTTTQGFGRTIFVGGKFTF